MRFFLQNIITILIFSGKKKKRDYKEMTHQNACRGWPSQQFALNDHRKQVKNNVLAFNSPDNILREPFSNFFQFFAQF